MPLRAQVPTSRPFLKRGRRCERFLLVIHGDEVVVSMVTNRELIGAMEAESNLIKVEAMAQRSYTVHRVVQRVASPPSGSIEDFIDRLERERATKRPTSRYCPTGRAVQ